jgi:hypothetical protein
MIFPAARLTALYRRADALRSPRGGWLRRHKHADTVFNVISMINANFKNYLGGSTRNVPEFGGVDAAQGVFAALSTEAAAAGGAVFLISLGLLIITRTIPVVATSSPR